MLSIKVMRNEVLGVDVVRGFAPLNKLASISRADVFDEKTNPNGTQRDLSPSHARAAYEYARNSKKGYWPEVFLCLRDHSVARFIDTNDGFGILEVDENKIAKSAEIAISRVDGNHRLHLADGKTPNVPPLEKTVSFCLAMDLTLFDEIRLFRDINDNQKRMDTSHLDKIELRLTEDDIVRSRNPSLFIASRLADDPDSPLRDFIYQGGKRPPGAFIPLRAMNTGIEYMLSRQTKLTAMGGADAQAVLIKNYFSALRAWVPEAWEQPKDYILLRGAGLWGSCFLGAEIIDRSLAKNSFSVDAMVEVLKSGKKWDWTRNGDFQGLSGRGGAVKIADTVIRELRDDQGVSMKQLIDEILKSGS